MGVSENTSSVEFAALELRARERNRTQQGRATAWAAGGSDDRRRSLASSFRKVPTHDLLLSHCWRSPEDIQKTKRRLIRALSAERTRAGGEAIAGWTYWADFLDLHASGPVAWRQEIENGVKGSAKVVCFIDGEYLRSFNCLQEVAFSVQYNKPIVPVIMDDEAWGYLFHPRGARELWEAADSSLSSHEGNPLTDTRKFSLAALEDLLRHLKRIQLCRCVDKDIDVLGWDQVCSMYEETVARDMGYLKEHRDLETRALTWHSRGRHRSDFLVGQDVERWRVWMAGARKRGKEPPPSGLQAQFLRASALHRRRLVGSVLALVILGLLLVCASMAVVLLYSKEAKQAQEAADLTTNMATVVLLSRDKYPVDSPGLRAAAAGGGLAASVDMSHLAIGTIHSAIWYISTLPYRLLQLGLGSSGHIDTVTAVAFSPDGASLASVSKDGTIRTWQLPSSVSNLPEDYLPVFSHSCAKSSKPPRLSSVAWSHDGEVVAAGSTGGQLCIRSTGSMEGSYPTSDNGVQVLSFRPGSARPYILATGCLEGSVAVWMVHSTLAAELHEAKSLTDGAGGPNPSPVVGLAWTPDGSKLVAGSAEGTVAVFSWDSGALTIAAHRLLPTSLQELTALAISPDPASPTLALAGVLGGSGTPCVLLSGVQMLDEAPWQEAPAPWVRPPTSFSNMQAPNMTELPGAGAAVTGLAWSDNSTRLAASSGTSILIWDASGGPSLPAVTIQGLSSESGSLAWRGARIARAASELTIDVVDVEPTPVPTDVQSHHKAMCGTDGMESVAWSPDSRFVAVGDDDGHICVLFAEATEPLVAILGHVDETGTGKRVSYLKWSPDGTMLASGGRDSLARLWSWSDFDYSLTQMSSFNASGEVRSLNFSPDGSHVLYSTKQKVAMHALDGENYTSLWQCELLEIGHGLLWGPGGVLALTQLRDIHIFRPVEGDPGSCAPLHILPSGNFANVKHLAMTADGQVLAGSSSRYAVLWVPDPKLGFSGSTTEELMRTRTTLLGHTGEIHAIAFSQDGSRFITASRTDTKLRLWDTSEVVSNGGDLCRSCALWEIIDTECEAVHFVDSQNMVSCAQFASNKDDLASSPLSPRVALDDGSLAFHTFSTDMERVLPVLRDMTYGSLTRWDLNMLGLGFMMQSENIAEEYITEGAEQLVVLQPGLVTQ